MIDYNRRMYTIGDTVTIHKDPFAYIAHPTITILASGDWLAGFNHSRRREPILHPPDDPLFRTLTSRSTDGGATWHAPVFAPDFDWYGTECPGLATTGTGTVLLSQHRLRWYPLPLAKKKREAGERISIALPENGWTEDFTEADWDRSQYTWARGYHGLYVQRSTDDGHLYEQTVRLECDPYRNGYTRTGVTLLSDGRLAYAVTEKYPLNIHTYLFFSEDDGVSWSAPVIICSSGDRSFGEPDIAETRAGEIYCILRESAAAPTKSGHLFDCRSTDGGRSWSKPQITTMFGKPGQLLVLGDGRLVCTYGRRTSPFAIRASVSEDGGRTWPEDGGIVIRDDLPNGDLGYPTAIEYEPGRLFCIFYGQHDDGVTCVMGTYVDLD